MQLKWCKECTVNFLNRIYLAPQLAFRSDSKSYEMFTGFLLLSWAIVFLFPNSIIAAGDVFGRILPITTTVTLRKEIWTLAFAVLGISRLVSSIFCSRTVRGIVSLIILYFWILSLYHVITAPVVYAIATGMFLLLTIYSVVMFVRMWNSKDGLY